MKEFHVIPLATYELQMENALRINKIPFSKGSTAVHPLIFRVIERYEFPMRAALGASAYGTLVQIETHKEKTFERVAKPLL